MSLSNNADDYVWFWYTSCIPLVYLSWSVVYTSYIIQSSVNVALVRTEATPKHHRMMTEAAGHV